MGFGNRALLRFAGVKPSALAEFDDKDMIMKPYLISLAAGLLVGAIYGLLNVRSPAPPVIALVGLLGMLLGERDRAPRQARGLIAAAERGLAAAPVHAACAWQPARGRVVAARSTASVSLTSRPDRSSRTRVGAWPISVGAFALWLTGAHLCAQTVQPAARSGSDNERPAYALQRDQEDWSFLRDPLEAARRVGSDQFIPLSVHGDSFLSLGGEWREQFNRFDNDQWGLVPDDTSGYLLQRYMFHADVRIGQSVRGFVQIKSGLETGRASGPRPTDEDRLDLHQAFVDVSVGRAAQSPVLTFRLGRQEFNLRVPRGWSRCARRRTSDRASTLSGRSSGAASGAWTRSCRGQ